LSFDDLVARARAAEVAGFVGMSGMDHLTPPLAAEQPMYEAMITTTWLAAHTDRLRLGSLVLCDAFRHPAVLAREAVSIDHAHGRRFDLGNGWGVPPPTPPVGVSSGASGGGRCPTSWRLSASARPSRATASTACARRSR